MTMEAAVLDQTESFDLDMHIVLLEPLDEKVDELLASIGGRLRNP
jgi:hypothetical protein